MCVGGGKELNIYSGRSLMVVPVTVKIIMTQSLRLIQCENGIDSKVGHLVKANGEIGPVVDGPN